MRKILLSTLQRGTFGTRHLVDQVHPNHIHTLTFTVIKVSEGRLLGVVYAASRFKTGNFSYSVLSLVV